MLSLRESVWNFVTRAKYISCICKYAQTNIAVAFVRYIILFYFFILAFFYPPTRHDARQLRVAM